MDIELERRQMREQLKKYALDFSCVYRAQKEKKIALEFSSNQLIKYAEDLIRSIEEIREKNLQLQDAYLDTITRLVLASEYKDENTGVHIVRIGRYSTLMARKLGLQENDVQNIMHAAPMHDIGKIGVPDNILLKEGKLTDEEYESMKAHTFIGANILADPEPEVLKVAQEITLSHHEQWDGKGYPHGIRKKEIPIAGRIVCLVDVFDALTTARPYKRPYPVEVAVKIIREQRGKHFDPELVDAFLECLDEVVQIKEEVSPASQESMTDFIWSERDKETYGFA
ncbi:MAG: HD domain-containing protein [Thermodesulfovibrionales bacterium]|nr:HD domain-containing protein [Thermodesulfovibrionales bacterium]